MVGDQRFMVRAGEAWLERPTDDIIGRADPHLGAVFHRFVILPPALAGGHASFIPCRPEAGDPTDAPFKREQAILAQTVVRSSPAKPGDASSSRHVGCLTGREGLIDS